MPMLFISSLIGLLILFFFAQRVRRGWRALIYLLIFPMAGLSLNFLTLDLRQIGSKYLANGESSLNSLEVATAYLSVVGMAIGGVLVGAPYAALENLLMLFPNDGNVTLDNDFPASSSKVKKLIESSSLSSSSTTEFPLLWDSYCQDTCDHGFALNGGALIVNRSATSCDASVMVSVSYKHQYRSSTLIASRFLVLRVDQAALEALQKLGYLHPYKISYRWAC